MNRFILTGLIAGVLCACGSGAAQPQIRNYTSEGNLEATKGGECVGLAAVDNTWTPADMAASEAACIRKGDYANAFDLSLAALVYGRYDVMRVADRSAHQAVQVLLMNAISGADEERQEAMRKHSEERMAQTEGRQMPICEEMKSLGRPDYYPRYMIQHGISAFTGRQGDGIVKDFDPEAAWQAVVSEYMRCP